MDLPRHRLSRLFAALLLGFPVSLNASVADEIGLVALRARHPDLPKGGNLTMLMCDFTSENTNQAWAVDPSGELAGKKVRYLPSSPKPKRYSPHSTGVTTAVAGRATGLLPELPEITSLWSGDYGSLVLRSGEPVPPTAPKWDFEVHTWNWSDEVYSQELVRRMDWRVDQQGVTVIEALPNGRDTKIPFVFTSGYNVITVGVATGTHSSGTTEIEVAGRTKPDLVAPTQYTSGATPLVAGCAGLLIAKAKEEPSLGAAKDPRVVKALLLAGATKEPIVGWAHTPTQPLDSHYGAGQLNIANSYAILLNGRQKPGAGEVAASGWDLGKADESRYVFEVPAGQRATFSAVLTWHRTVTPEQSWTRLPSALPDLNLTLARAVDGSESGPVLMGSSSTVDNVEHLYTTDLREGRYLLSVPGPKGTVYGLAWRTVLRPAPEEKPAVPAKTTASPSRRQLRQGMSADEVRALVGAPHAVTPFEVKGVRGERWTYTYRRKLAERIVPTGYREISRVDAATGETVKVNEPIPGNEITYESETTEILMVDNAMAQAKRSRVITREIQ